MAHMLQYVATDGVEQLWYTWSTTGLDTVAAGFRVRAASSGLTDLYGERMKQLDRYLRYSLPSGSDPLRYIERLQEAPICLAFIRTESGERVLVNKVYTGKDGRGRPGAYFAHMLVQLPRDYFSARDAIRFWRSPFWRTSDLSVHEQGTNLPDLSLLLREHSPVEMRNQEGHSAIQEYVGLRKEGQKIPLIHFEDIEALLNQFRGVDFPHPFAVVGTQFKAIDKQSGNTNELYEHLCFIIRAYLLRQDEIEKQERERAQVKRYILDLQTRLQQGGIPRAEVKQLKLALEEEEAQLQLMEHYETPRIFIAAPPDEVAYLIAGLTRVLPRHFLKDITFSTYEDDVLTKLPLHIIGTAQPLFSLTHGSTHRDILPSACYQKGFALNTYLEKYSQLDEIRLKDAVPDQDYVEDYARFAVEELQKAAHEKLQRRRREQSTTFSTLTPMDELDQFFREDLDDRPEISIDALPQLSVYDFLTKYYYAIVNQQRTLAENELILGDPHKAEEALRTSRYRKQLFVRVYSDSKLARQDMETQKEHLVWLDNKLPNYARRLRNKLGIAPQLARNLNDLLDRLAEEPVSRIYDAATKNDLEGFQALFSSFNELIWEREEVSVNIGGKLLDDCCNNQKAKNFVIMHQEAREKLLALALVVLQPESAIASFLLDVNVLQFGLLLPVLQKNAKRAAGQYIGWLHLATHLFLSKGHSSSSDTVLYDKQAIQHLEKHFDQMKELITQLSKIPLAEHIRPEYRQWHETAWKLFWALAESGYNAEYKRMLLSILLTNTLDDENLPDLLTIAARVGLNGTQEEKLLEDYGPELLRRGNGGSRVAPLFWQIANRHSPNKMKLLFKLLDKPVEWENFTSLLQAQQSSLYFNAEEAHIFLLRYSDYYANEYAHRDSNARYISSTLRDKVLPQYLLRYPGALPLWETIYDSLHQTLPHARMPLIHAWIPAAIQAIAKKQGMIGKQHMEHFLHFVALSNDELYEVLYRFGPTMLESKVKELALLVSESYAALADIYRNLPLASGSVSLLYMLLDKHPDPGQEVANALLTSTSFTDSEVHAFFRRYGHSYPPYCYRLSASSALRKRLKWSEVQPYIGSWLEDGMFEHELEEVFGEVSLASFDARLLEKYGQNYLTNYPHSIVLLRLTSEYLQAFDATSLQHIDGRNFLRFLYKYEGKDHPGAFGDLLDKWRTIQNFIDHPSLRQEHLLTAFRLIYDSSPDAQQWIKLLSPVLMKCVNQRSDLGYAFSSMCMVNPEYPIWSITDMAKAVGENLKASYHRENLKASYHEEIWGQRTAILLESIFLPGLLDSLSKEDREGVLRTLLQGAGNEFFSFIDNLAASWTPDVRKRWRAAAQQYKPSRPSTQAPPPNVMLAAGAEMRLVPVASSVPTPSEVGKSRSKFSMRGPIRAPFSGVRRLVISVHAWLLFPWLLVRLWWLCGQKGTGRLSRFWFDHHYVLEVYSGLTPRLLKQRLKFACAFHNACQGTGDVVSLLELPENQKYRETLTNHEIWMIQLAAFRTGRAIPISTQISTQSGWQSIFYKLLSPPSASGLHRAPEGARKHSPHTTKSSGKKGNGR